MTTMTGTKATPKNTSGQKQCLHCKAWKNTIAGRGLCPKCYNTPAIREKYPRKKGNGMSEPANGGVEEVKTEKYIAASYLVGCGHDVEKVDAILTPLSNLLTKDELVEVFRKKIKSLESVNEPVPTSEPGEEVDASFEEIDEELEIDEDRVIELLPEPHDGPAIFSIELKTHDDVDIYEKIVGLAADTRRTPGDWALCALEDYLANKAL